MALLRLASRWRSTAVLAALMPSLLICAALASVPRAAGGFTQGSRPSGVLVFAGAPVGQRPDIYTVRVDGTGLRRLTHTPSVSEDAPVWSPDGRTIAFAEDRVGPEKGTIALMHADGSRIGTVTPRDSVSRNPSWAPDGKRIAYDSNRAYGGAARLHRDIYTINLDGSQLRRLPVRRPRWHSAVGPAWSPGGTKIAFWAWSDSPPAWEPGIYVMNADGRRVRRLTRPAGTDRHPDWSPDGRRIVFHSRADEDLYVLDVATGLHTALLTPRSIEADLPEDPVWSPDGRHIAFVDGNASDPASRAYGSAIYVMRPDGTELVEVLGPGRWKSTKLRYLCCPDWKRAPR
jgi:TolB protein